jgi:hypothetical protein
MVPITTTQLTNTIQVLMNAGYFPGIASLSKGKLRGILTLLRESKLVTTYSPIGEVVRLQLTSASTTQYAQFRDNHDTFLLHYAMNVVGVNIPVEYRGDIVWIETRTDDSNEDSHGTAVDDKQRQLEGENKQENKPEVGYEGGYVITLPTHDDFQVNNKVETKPVKLSWKESKAQAYETLIQQAIQYLISHYEQQPSSQNAAYQTTGAGVQVGSYKSSPGTIGGGYAPQAPATAWSSSFSTSSSTTSSISNSPPSISTNLAVPSLPVHATAVSPLALNAPPAPPVPYYQTSTTTSPYVSGGGYPSYPHHSAPATNASGYYPSAAHNNNNTGIPYGSLPPAVNKAPAYPHSTSGGTYPPYHNYPPY